MDRRNIVLNHDDYNVLKNLLESWKRSGKARLPHVARLAEEVKAAVVMDGETIPDDVVTIRSRVSFRHLSGDAAEATEQAVIVFPVHCSEAAENVSILSPLGMALIGEREGSEVEYVAPGGTYRIRIEAVAPQQTPRVLQRE